MSTDRTSKSSASTPPVLKEAGNKRGAESSACDAAGKTDMSSKRFKAADDVGTIGLVAATVSFVRAELAGNDASHDWSHIERVWRLARRLASDEGLDAEAVELVELASILHDIDDWKYSGSETAGVEAARAFLGRTGLDATKVERICYIIQRVSFHDELGRSAEERRLQAKDKALACVQDADRLDAIGAIGIARTFTYGGKKMRQLYSAEDLAQGPAALQAMKEADAAAVATAATGGKPEEGGIKMATKEEYGKKGKDSCTTFHFHEKLFHLRGMMKTEAGRQVATDRHDFMVTFLDRIYKECAGEK